MLNKDARLGGNILLREIYTDLSRPKPGIGMSKAPCGAADRDQEAEQPPSRTSRVREIMRRE